MITQEELSEARDFWSGMDEYDATDDLGAWSYVQKLVLELLNEVDRLRGQKDAAYTERDQLVCALSKVFPAHLCRHPEEDTEWEDDWRWIVCVHLPTGQATWHIHDSERDWFDHLSVQPNHWDGHTTEMKYQRLSRIRNNDK